ncbi:hypothetical protein GCK32_022770 [Trichostrongylus colubriformis]|uniref:Uncharacterized protein n=1 Tax=Trichostrongylus colubriformis TaxID=6319 RepID=A0AAN8IQL1_TRICO
MGINLCEFMSNHNTVFDAISEKDRMKATCSTVKLLGLKWDTEMDILTVPIKSISKEVASKRTALKAMASTFDPLGLLTPLFIRLKMFIQVLWINKYDWETHLTKLLQQDIKPS